MTKKTGGSRFPSVQSDTTISSNYRMANEDLHSESLTNNILSNRVDLMTMVLSCSWIAPVVFSLYTGHRTSSLIATPCFFYHFILPVKTSIHHACSAQYSIVFFISRFACLNVTMSSMDCQSWTPHPILDSTSKISVILSYDVTSFLRGELHDQCTAYNNIKH